MKYKYWIEVIKLFNVSNYYYRTYKAFRRGLELVEPEAGGFKGDIIIRGSILIPNKQS